MIEQLGEPNWRCLGFRYAEKKVADTYIHRGHLASREWRCECGTISTRRHRVYERKRTKGTHDK
jgi:hypothetical protein